jgi:hypothetical protein
LHRVELVKPHVLESCLSFLAHFLKGFFPGFPCLRKKEISKVLNKVYASKRSKLTTISASSTYLSISFLCFPNFLLDKLLREREREREKDKIQVMERKKTE